MTIQEWAETVNLTSFLADDKVTAELYGYKNFVFSPEKVQAAVKQGGWFATSGPDYDEAVEILEERVESFLSLPR